MADGVCPSVPLMAGLPGAATELQMLLKPHTRRFGDRAGGWQNLMGLHVQVTLLTK